jgi:hypothetical protein
MVCHSIETFSADTLIWSESTRQDADADDGDVVAAAAPVAGSHVALALDFDHR